MWTGYASLWEYFLAFSSFWWWMSIIGVLVCSSVSLASVICRMLFLYVWIFMKMSYRDTNWIKYPTSPVWPHLNSFHLQQSNFHVRTDSEILEVRILINHVFMGEPTVTHDKRLYYWGTSLLITIYLPQNHVDIFNDHFCALTIFLLIELRLYLPTWNIYLLGNIAVLQKW